MKMNRLIKAVLSSLTIGSILACPALAVNEARYSLQAEQDEHTVKVSVTLESEEGVTGVQYTLSYDPSLVTLQSAALRGSYRSMMNAINTETEGKVILAAASATAVEAEPVVMELNFQTSATAGTDVLFVLSDAMVSDAEAEGHYMEQDITAKVTIGSDAPSEIISSQPSGGTSEQDNQPEPAGTQSPDIGTSDVSDNSIPDSQEDITSDTFGNESMQPQSTEESEQPPSVSQQPVFTDIGGHWASDYILQANKQRLMDGYGGGRFGPDDSLTRAQMATVLWNGEGKPKPKASSSFTDLTQDWYRDAVAWVEEKGIFHGIGQNRFDPDGTLTREQLAQVLFNYSGSGKGIEATLTGIYDSQYGDSSQISGWAKSAMYWALYNEILCGTNSVEPSQFLNPDAPASRAQIAVMMVRFQKKYK